MTEKMVVVVLVESMALTSQLLEAQEVVLSPRENSTTTMPLEKVGAVLCCMILLSEQLQALHYLPSGNIASNIQGILLI